MIESVDMVEFLAARTGVPFPVSGDDLALSRGHIRPRPSCREHAHCRAYDGPPRKWWH